MLGVEHNDQEESLKRGCSYFREAYDGMAAIPGSTAHAKSHMDRGYSIWMNRPFFSFFIAIMVVFLPATVLGADDPLWRLDCPFFLKWSVDWETCVVQWNTYYGLIITLTVLGIIVTAAVVAIWKLYGIAAKRRRDMA